MPKQLPLTELPEERLHLGFVAFGEHEDFFAVKGALEDLAASFGVTFEVERAEDVPYLHPGIAAYILCNGVRVGSFGKLANDVQAGLDLPRDSRANQKIFLGEIDYETLVHSCLPVCVIIRCRSSIPWPVTWLWLLTRKPPAAPSLPK